MKNICILSIFFLSVASCAYLPRITVPKGGDEERCEEQIQAEYRLMKNNLSLAMRENEVVKGENVLCRTETGQLKKSIEDLQGDLGALNQKYDQDMAMMTGKLESLQTQYTDLEEQGKVKIQELTDINLETENKLALETARFDQTLKTQQETFTAERQAMESDFAGQKQQYENRLAVLSNDLQEKQTALVSLKTDYANAMTQIEKMQQTIADSQTMMETMRKTIADNQTMMETMRKTIDGCNETLASMRKTIDENQGTIAAKQKTIEKYKTTISSLLNAVDADRTTIEIQRNAGVEKQPAIQKSPRTSRSLPEPTQQKPAE